MKTVESYTNKEAAELLKLSENDIKALRERVGISPAGNLSENNITAIKSYIRKVGYTPKKRGRPKKQESIDEKKQQSSKKTQETQESTQPLYFTMERVQELVKEAHDIGYKKAKAEMKPTVNIGVSELLCGVVTS